MVFLFFHSLEGQLLVQLICEKLCLKCLKHEIRYTFRIHNDNYY